MGEQSFTDMAAATTDLDVPSIGVGVLGYSFMGKAHSNALKTLPYMIYPPPAIPELVAICGRDAGAVAEAARRYGYARHYTDWRDLIDDERVQLFDNGGPNDVHAEPCIAAAAAGKHVICEKPLARNAEEAATMLAAVRDAGVKHMVAFNLPFRARHTPGSPADRERRAGPYLPLSCGLPSGVDPAALRHAENLATRQGARR